MVPNPKAAGCVKAAGFSHRPVLDWVRPTQYSRSSRSPLRRSRRRAGRVRPLHPGTRWRAIRVLARRTTGKPLSNATIDEIVQSPRMHGADAALRPALAFAERQLDDRREHQLVRHVEEARPCIRRRCCSRSAACRWWSRRSCLAELVVLQAAVGVVEAAAPAVAHALLELQIAAWYWLSPSGGLPHEDVVELRERTQ